MLGLLVKKPGELVLVKKPGQVGRSLPKGRFTIGRTSHTKAVR